MTRDKTMNLVLGHDMHAEGVCEALTTQRV